MFLSKDTQWTDIDAMDSHRDWSYDTNKFANLPAIVEDLHNHGQHYINIIDPAISTTSGYEPYDDGLANNVFIKYLGTNEPLVGKVWPGSTVFPDFTNPNTSQWWTKMATNFHKNISFDGLWIVSFTVYLAVINFKFYNKKAKNLGYE